MKKLVIDGATRKISKDKIVVGYLQENRTEKIEFEIPQEYQNYGRKACFEAEGNIFSKTFDNITGNTLTLTRDITKFEKIKMSIEFFKIENEDEIIARTSILNLIIENSVICDDDVKPDDPKVTILDELIVEVGKTINETNNLDIDIQDSVVTITKKDGTTKSENVKGETGSKGEDAKINGVNSIVLEAGDNIEIEQDGQKTIIKSIASGNVEDVYVDGTSVLDENKIAQIDLSGKADKTEIPTKTSDLTNDSNFAKTNSNNNFSAAQTINGTLTVNGDIVQNGESYETHAEQLFTKNDLIKTRDGAIGGLADNELTGIEAINYDGANNGRLAFDSKGVARVGDVGDEQPLLTRDEEVNLTTGQVLVWDGTNLRAIGSSDYVKNTDYATLEKAGIVKNGGSSMGIQINANGVPYIEPATGTDIMAKTSHRKPIVPSNLDYAVRSVLPLANDTVPSTLVANTEYYLGETASLSFAFPTTGEKGQYCFVKFDSGTTATALTITGTNYVGDIPTPEASKSYEILATWNGAEWVATYRAY